MEKILSSMILEEILHHVGNLTIFYSIQDDAKLLFRKFDTIYAEEAVYELPSDIINEAIYYMLIQQIWFRYLWKEEIKLIIHQKETPIIKKILGLKVKYDSSMSGSLGVTRRNTSLNNLLLRAQNSKLIPSSFELDTIASQACWQCC